MVQRGALWKLDCDVLVVGAGGAAGRAALAASDAGCRVAVVTKRRAGKAGATAVGGRITAVGAFNCARPERGDHPDLYYQDMAAAAAGTCSPPLARIIADEAPAAFDRLRAMGVPFVTEGDGLLQVTGCFSTRPRSYLIPGHGLPIVTAQTEELRRRGVPLLDDCSLVELLVDSERVIGAVVWHPERGFGVARCGAVILGTGGAGNVFPLTFSPPDVTGDGYGAALRAGAVLANMEFVQFGYSLLHPAKNEFESWVWALQPRVLNGEGREFLPARIGGLPVADVFAERSTHYPFSASRPGSRMLDVLIQREISRGSPTPHGGVWLDFSAVGALPDGLSRLWRITADWFQSRGVDLEHQPIEVGLVAHAFNGGLAIDENAESSVGGLFAAGECATGPHGADRLGGNMLLASQVFGERAGRYAAGARDVASWPRVEDGAEAHLGRLLAGRAATDQRRLRRQLQLRMAAAGALGREREGMSEALTWVREAQEVMSGLRWEDRTGPLLLDMRNLLLSAESLLMAALLREESRGSHFRTDLPDRDDRRWAKPVFSRLAGGTVQPLSATWPAVRSR
ncbi:FAD-binding protein [bacterium]|nr:MAG: FAD-binding protein [bacterium]